MTPEQVAQKNAREDFIAILQSNKYRHKSGWTIMPKTSYCNEPLACAIAAWTQEKRISTKEEHFAYLKFQNTTGLPVKDILRLNDEPGGSYEKVIQYVQQTIERDFLQS